MVALGLRVAALLLWMGFTQDGSSKGGAAVKFYLTQCVQIYSGGELFEICQLDKS